MSAGRSLGVNHPPPTRTACSELILAEAPHPYAEGLKIGTKAGFTREGPDRWTTNGHPDYLRERVDGSLKKLRVERLDLSSYTGSTQGARGRPVQRAR